MKQANPIVWDIGKIIWEIVGVLAIATVFWMIFSGGETRGRLDCLEDVKLCELKTQ